MARGIHTSMENAYHSNTVGFEAEIDDMPLDRITPITGPDVATVLGWQSGLSQSPAGLFNQLGVMRGLFQSPLLYCVIEDAI